MKWKHPATVLLSTTMQRYNTNTTNMTFDDSGYFGSGQENFCMDTDQAGPGHDVDDGQPGSRNVTTSSLMANFTASSQDRLDPSAGFPGLGELPSGGMESAVENNLTGTFTGDLNASAYDVGEDHSQLLQDMLQQQSQTQSGQSTQVSQVLPKKLYRPDSPNSHT